ncbi:MAG: hypothetical protein QG584_75, partial [Pseudomonadota bacterium]|nr:hypothetical protein [Pseudomonadota bacterium]
MIEPTDAHDESRDESHNDSPRARVLRRLLFGYALVLAATLVGGIALYRAQET